MFAALSIPGLIASNILNFVPRKLIEGNWTAIRLVVIFAINLDYGHAY